MCPHDGVVLSSGLRPGDVAESRGLRGGVDDVGEENGGEHSVQLGHLVAGRSRSEVVRDAVQRQLALAQFQDLRRRIMPLAEARGYLTDEDVFRDVS